jgi:tryprostatin B 6-hydroxylase
MRTTIVKLITTFHVGFAPGEDGKAFEQQAQDNFVLYMGPLHLTFTRRK